MKQRFPVRRSLELNVYKTRNEMGKAAAQDVAAAMKKFIKAKGKVVMVFAAAPSQDEFLSHLVENTGDCIGPGSSVSTWMSTSICPGIIPTPSKRICASTFLTS